MSSSRTSVDLALILSMAVVSTLTGVSASLPDSPPHQQAEDDRVDMGAPVFPLPPSIQASEEGWRIRWQGGRSGSETFHRTYDSSTRSWHGFAHADQRSSPASKQEAALRSGSVRVFEQFDQDEGSWTIFGQLFDPFKYPLGEPFRISSRGNDHRVPAVSRMRDGGFVVVWQADRLGWDILLKRFDATGRELGTAERVNAETAGDQMTPMVAVAQDAVAVVWLSELLESGSWGVFVRLSEGLIFGDDFEGGGVEAWSEAVTPPTATFIAMPESGQVPFEVLFDASASLDPGGTIESYHWDFGDGETGSGITSGHTYTVAGMYNVTLTVTDDAGSTADVSRTIDARPEFLLPPTAAFEASPVVGSPPLHVAFDATASSDPDGIIASFLWDFGDGATASGVMASHTFDQPGAFRVRLVVVDDHGLEAQADQTIAALPDVVALLLSSPANAETNVSLTRATNLSFDGALDPVTVTSNSISAAFAGETLASSFHLSADGTKVTLFFAEPLPERARIRVTVDGDRLHDALGRPVDADGDGQAGGTETVDFDTLGQTPLPDTRVCGIVFASESAPDDLPIQGVTISLEGVENGPMASTGPDGRFCLDPSPAGTFFVHIDGRTAANPVPPGAFYPSIGKSWTAVAGAETDIGNVYLPLIAADTLQPVSESADTEIRFPDSVLMAFPELADVVLTVPADSLFADNGTRGGQVGMAPVAPDRLPEPLPPELNLPLVITVQTDGASNFDVPAPICLPNLADPDTGNLLEPGAASGLWSFDHDSGRWTLAGPMTVNPAGTLICTDSGVGINAPGWHGTQPGCSGGGGGRDGCQAVCVSQHVACKNACGPGLGCITNCNGKFAQCSTNCETT